MSTQVQNEREPGMGSLVKGIVSDMGDLIKQQLDFAQHEVKKDLKDTARASTLLIVGAVVALLGLVLLLFTLVHLLHAMTSPPGTDPASLPLWACHGIVTLVTLAIAGGLLGAGVKKFHSFNPLPDQTVQTIKENVEWITNSK